MKILSTTVLNSFAIIFFSVFALTPLATAEEEASKDHWKPAKKIELTDAKKKMAERAEQDKLFLSQPTILAYKTALFLANGSFDTPTNGRVQSIEAKFEGGEETFQSVTVTVEFMGYADDSLFGERFTLKLKANDKGNWEVVHAERAAYGRGDHK